MSGAVPAVVLGGTGYVAGELLRLIALHPQLRLAAVMSDSARGEPVAGAFPHLQSAYPQEPFRSEAEVQKLLREAPQAALFSAAPHGVSAPLIDRLLAAAEQAGTAPRVVDLSADFRYANADAYTAVYRHPHGAPARLAHLIAKPFVWANWRGLESLLKVQFNLGKCKMVPETRIEDGVNCSVPIATPGFFPMVADGRIKAIRGSFDHYEADTIVMSNGERVKADIAVLAIGYKLGVPFLPEVYRNKLVDPDGQYRLYRLIANPDLPDLGFVGFNSSFCTVLCADMAAHWLVRYADSQLAHQPSEREMRDNIELMLHFKRVERPAASVYGGLCVAPYHYKHFDELLADIGATKRRRSALAEMFTPPDADAYAQFLASAPNYHTAA